MCSFLVPLCGSFDAGLCSVVVSVVGFKCYGFVPRPSFLIVGL